MRVKCPHCRYYGAVRDSEEMSDITGMAIYRCGNDICGHVYEVGFEVIATISPSSMPNPDVKLPIRKPSPCLERPLPQTRRQRLQALARARSAMRDLFDEPAEPAA
ncbi:hypothetical protein D3C72_1317630 [compost metagenome]